MLAWMARVAAAVAALGGSPWLADAATFDEYSSFHVIGDSLSDNGNVHSATFGLLPGRNYWRGRFSNGPVWADRIQDDFEALGKPTTNYAFGGAQALGIRNPVPDVPAQIQVLRLLDQARGKFGERPLVGIWAGANDLFGAIGSGRSRQVGRRAADSVGNSIRSLARSDVEDFVVLNLPDLGEIPRYAGTDLQERATRATLAFNQRLDREVRRLRRRGLQITLIDAYEHFEAIRADPAAFGLDDVTGTCVRRGIACPPEQAERMAFWDPVHPTTTIHGIIADEVRNAFGQDAVAALAALRAAEGGAPLAQAAIAPVPVPAPAALLLAGLASLVLLRRRPGRSAA